MSCLVGTRPGRNGRPILTIAGTPLRRAYPPMLSDEFDGFLKAIDRTE